jgi:hypothetical protein
VRGERAAGEGNHRWDVGPLTKKFVPDATVRASTIPWTSVHIFNVAWGAARRSN